MTTWVVKLGGAMMRSPALPHWLNVALSQDAKARIVLVPGGGALANHVRDLHAEWKFDEVVAHALALEAMRMNAMILHSLVPLSRMASDTSEIANRAEHGQTAIWVPPRPFTTDAFPASWAATSDSIALYVAQRLAADALFLVKSVNADSLVECTATSLSRDGLLDDYFPQLFARGRLLTRVVAKSQSADFAEAYRLGDANRVGVAVLG